MSSLVVGCNKNGAAIAQPPSSLLRSFVRSFHQAKPTKWWVHLLFMMMHVLWTAPNVHSRRGGNGTKTTRVLSLSFSIWPSFLLRCSFSLAGLSGWSVSLHVWSTRRAWNHAAEFILRWIISNNAKRCIFTKCRCRFKEWHCDCRNHFRDVPFQRASCGCVNGQ